MKHITSVEFCFENVEVMSFDAKYIGRCDIEGVSEAVHRIACNSIAHFVTADRVAVEIFSEANDTYYPMGDTNSETTKFERILAWDDIVVITLKYDDGSEEEFYVDYDEGAFEGDLGAENINQHVMLSDLGNLYIVIGKDMALYDRFDADTINSEDFMKFNKRMQDVTKRDEENSK